MDFDADRDDVKRPSRSIRHIAVALSLVPALAACASAEPATDDTVAEPTADATATPVAEPSPTATPEDLAFVDPAVAATNFALVVDPNGAIVGGVVPDDEARFLLVTHATQSFPEGTIVDRLETAGVPLTDEGRANLEAAATMIRPVSANLRTGTLSLVGATLRLEGSAYDRPAAAALDRALGATGLDELWSVTIPEPGTESALQTAINELDLQSIQFAVGTADLTAQAQAVLAEVAELLNGNPRVRVQVEGHTDGQGTAEDNLELSQQRAEAVVVALDGLGVDTSRLSARGFGEERPLADNTSDEGRALNRRVELIVQED